MKTIRQFSFIAFMAVIAGHTFASEPPSWWMLCDSCESDSQFAMEAMRAPSPYTIVYVSNRETNETRKFERESVMDEMGDGLQHLTTVTPQDIGPDLRGAFELVIDRANENNIDIARNELSGISPSGSIAGDMAGNAVAGGLAGAIRDFVNDGGYLPDHISVNRHGGASIAGFGGNAGAGSTVRIQDIVITITYEDGSTLRVVRDGDTGAYVNWELKDADGNRIPVEDPGSNGVPSLPLGSLLNQTFVFDVDYLDWVLWLADMIQYETGAQCRSTTGTRDGVDVVTVTCSR